MGGKLATLLLVLFLQGKHSIDFIFQSGLSNFWLNFTLDSHLQEAHTQGSFE